MSKILRIMETKQYAIYIRVSTKMQGVSKLGLEAQRETCMNYISSVKGVCVNEFSDIESGKSRVRKGLFEAIDFCKSNKCTLVVAKLDRLARDVEFTFRVINTGVDIYFIDMPNVNTMILGVFASVAQYERELISSRTKSALDAKKRRGELLGNQRGIDMSKANVASAETRSQRVKEDPNSQMIWRYICQHLDRGELETKEDWEDLCTGLNGMHIRTSSGLEFTVPRLKSTYKTLKKTFN